ncbi:MULTISPECIES: M20 family metallopeptidase [unclassified Pseudodesulfovibrio]|uniref:M20 family metallopeptidase n=1 Tax=unclassified Pseudodesulfovibrio TaxID=2661612 RepID=UPI0013E34A07|nr:MULTISPECIES: M20 family metallopeptidase [unclassified Pseudodesulfovibrio]MCJ2164720.1 M20 family metallopeptidase [Pseudodesulfovibrio sp. S3-i]
MIDTINSYLTAHESEMFDLLEQLVNINSYSANPEGVNRVVDVLEEVMHGMGFTTRRLSNDFTGDNLVAENQARIARGGGPLLVGHMDTVFAPEMGFDTFRRDADKVFGPGVTDMKGGLVIGIFAAKALAAAGQEHLPLGFFFNADEEIGSPHSRNLIVEEARKSDFCFVMEGSGMGGEVVTGRKGRIVYDLTVTGQAAHAGHCSFPKPSAIVEIAHKITALEALNDPDEGTSLNIGLIEGGANPNTVAAKATVRGETRFLNTDKGDAVWARIMDIAATSTVEGTSGHIEILTNRPPMVTNETILGLYSIVEASAKEIGMDVKAVFRGGGSDANTVSQAGIPVVDGMGPSGAKFHTPDEYMLSDSMVKQALLTAVSAVNACKEYK